jgi:hypothetical protein
MALSRSRGVAVVLIVGVALGASSSAALSSEANAIVSASTLTLIDGAVLVRHGAAPFTPAQKGDVLAAGDIVRTATGASAEITYFEGSSVRMDADKEVVVTRLGAEADGGTVVGMMRMLGDAWGVVTKLISGGSRYEVRTPSSTASVRG